MAPVHPAITPHANRTIYTYRSHENHRHPRYRPLITACAAPSAKAEYCRPYITHTCVVHSRTECRWATDQCGRRYSYEVRVVSYRSYYNNGQNRNFTKTCRA